MGVKNLLFNEESEAGKYFFQNMLKWLDNPNRQKYNNPEKLLKASGIQLGQTVLEMDAAQDISPYRLPNYWVPKVYSIPLIFILWPLKKPVRKRMNISLKTL